MLSDDDGSVLLSVRRRESRIERLIIGAFSEESWDHASVNLQK